MCSLLVTMLSPSSALTGMKYKSGIWSCEAKLVKSAQIRSKTSSLKSTRSILLTATTTWWMPSSDAMNAWRRDCGRTPLRASISTMARFAVEAPVAMLRVYCSWPGVSAMMNFRLGGGKIAVRDVDGDALFALGAQAVGEQREVHGAGGFIHGCFGDGRELVLVHSFGVVEQAADQRGFSVVDAAAGEEAEQVLFFLPAQELVDSA